MVLTDREIQIAIQQKLIIIDPSPDPTAYSSTSLDLSLAKYLRVWKATSVGVDQIVCPAVKGYTFSEVSKTHSDLIEIGADGYILEPQSFVLGWTEESVELPVSSRVAARVEGKSSLARLAIGIHVTAPTIHAGFNGPIQLEICNHGPLRVKVIAGMRVC